MTDHDKLKKELAVANATAMFQNLAIVGALAECHLVDPTNIAGWAEFFATGMENSALGGSAHLQRPRKVAARLRNYARQLVSIVKTQENSK
ncbi:hypothetical protein QEV83_16280 [Methylocapsa sp. D3K7]|uniref:hypothetical protein n=1 Tax=Methylocapsa sp. D3K7 TaxID=3041435 RepID=UPI00244E8123|nr:hypothetical protein [Methylocapsa sp. D3K7]WGJ14187.1 hypothetical protein QEV83_16280 [Methylocapsa sp. D3K7]